MMSSQDDSFTAKSLKFLQSSDCHVCGKAFQNRYNLKVHVRSHTGERPFTCLSCKKGFTTKANMQKHYLSCVKRYHTA